MILHPMTMMTVMMKGTVWLLLYIDANLSMNVTLKMKSKE